MTDYNDGNWHGWNGGECPVHHETVVQIQMRNETRLYVESEGESAYRPASQWTWRHDNDEYDIIAFRVVRVYREPREFWVAQSGGVYVQVAGIGSCPDAFKVREVLK